MRAYLPKPADPGTPATPDADNTNPTKPVGPEGEVNSKTFNQEVDEFFVKWDADKDEKISK